MDTMTKINGKEVPKGIEDRFTAAVNVIRGLPKNGSYQPSNDMMLRFYSYFKQATLGPCTQKKPPFWDVVGRAKYDAYKALGKMPKERAMELYVEELKKIIETMSYTDNVADFMGSISELDNVDVDDLEAVAPEAIKKVKSQPNSPFASRESSPVRASERALHYRNGNENGYSNTRPYENGNGNYLQNGHINSTDHSDDEYIDTVEDDSYLIDEPTVHSSRPWTRRSRVSQPEIGLQGLTDVISGSSQTLTPLTNGGSHHQFDMVDVTSTINQLLKTVNTMRSDVQQIHTRINLLERSLGEVKNQQLRKKILDVKYPTWWPFAEISPTWFIFMIVWPFLAHRIMQTIQKKK